MKIWIIVFTTLLLSLSRPAESRAELTPAELDWLFKNWISLDVRRHCVGDTCIEMAFPDMVTMVELMDDTTTYQQAYKNWVKRCCKAAANLVYLDLCDYVYNQDIFLANYAKLGSEEMRVCK